jgi:competence protein ComEA
MHIDWLTIVETYERAVEAVESKLRRHRRAILICGIGAALALGACCWPRLAAQRAEERGGSGRPRSSPASPRPASRAPRPTLERSSFKGDGRAPGPARAPEHDGEIVASLPAEDPSPTPDKGAGVSSGRSPRGARNEASVPAPSPWIYVQVSGAVRHPGVVRMRTGARGFQALAAAGGARPDADLAAINLARKLEDEGMLVVPSRNEAVQRRLASAPPPGEDRADPGDNSLESGRDASPQASDPEPGAAKETLAALESHPISLNSADAAMLQRVPGIGPSLARAIVDWRRRNGPFRAVEDLIHVRRFGPRLLAHVRRCLTL